MPEAKQPSTMGWMWPLILSIPLPSFLNMAGYAQTAFVSVDLLIVGGGILASGLLLKFIALPKANTNPGDDPDRTIAWHRALAGPLILLGALIAGLGGTLMVVPGDSRSVDITWASFCLALLIDLGVITARAIRVFSVRPRKQ